ncbi:MAG: hypothetical protein WDO73_02880 [Ignavibacteriota bacterium]
MGAKIAAIERTLRDAADALREIDAGNNFADLPTFLERYAEAVSRLLRQLQKLGIE